MKIIEIVAIILFVGLLLMGAFLIYSFYICDKQNCCAFIRAEEKAQPGTKEYTIALMKELCSDGMWPLSFFGAAILTPFGLLLIQVKITPRIFAIVFFVSFAITYFLMSFFIHHYIEFIIDYTINYIEDNSQIP